MVNVNVFFDKLVPELVDVDLILKVHILKLVLIYHIQISLFRLVQLVFKLVINDYQTRLLLLNFVDPLSFFLEHRFFIGVCHRLKRLNLSILKL